MGYSRAVILLCVSLNASAFDYYDSTIYSTSKASDYTSTVEKVLNIQYESDFTFVGGSNANQVTQASAESAADDAFSSGADIVQVDIESWETTTQAGRLATKAKAEEVIGWMKAKQPSLQIGWFGLIPINNYSASITGEGNATYQAWQTANDEISFCSSVDVVYPELYIKTYEAKPYTNTLAYVEAHLKEAQRLCPTAELVPILWPMYFQSVTTVRNNIAGISSGNPAVLTTSGSTDVQTGMQVHLREMTGATEINDKWFRVTRLSSTTFSLAGVNGASITPYVSGGAISTAIPADLWVAVLEVIRRYTDKAALWESGARPWSSDIDWWQYTVARKQRMDSLPVGYSNSPIRFVRLREYR